MTVCQHRLTICWGRCARWVLGGPLLPPPSGKDCSLCTDWVASALGQFPVGIRIRFRGKVCRGDCLLQALEMLRQGGPPALGRPGPLFTTVLPTGVKDPLPTFSQALAWWHLPRPRKQLFGVEQEAERMDRSSFSVARAGWEE